ncbi:MAG TPA: AfsR/SARP family transcriptional regulator [Actinocrinis sp.]|nr:AfsR/SARP family transcriptional regulator [Actinocrinis sp.]
MTVAVEEGHWDVGAAKVRTMLAMLALDAGRVVSHADLADELWSERPLANVRNALQAQATRLRRVLRERMGQPEATVVRAVQNGYVLDLPAQEVDAHRFLDQAARGIAALRECPAHALEILSEAARIWRGPALVDAGDGLRCRSAAALFEERRLIVLEDIAAARILVGEQRQAIAELRRLVDRYPLHERFCALLMLALYRSGRQVDSLDVFHHTRQRLDRDLGVQPGAMLHRLHAQILAHSPALMSQDAVLDGERNSDHRVPTALTR